MCTSGYQIYGQLQTDSHQIGAHHGVALYGLILLIKEFLSMVQTTDKAIKHIQAEKSWHESAFVGYKLILTGYVW